MMRSPLLDRFDALATSDAPCVIDDEGARYAYEDVVRAACTVAASLLEAGGGGGLAGERVAVFVEPGPTFVAAFFGVLLAGGCVVVLSPLHSAAESAFFCDDANVRTVLVSGAWEARAGTFGGGRRTAVVESLLAERVGAPPHKARGPLPFVSADDAALQLYTSGTTGRPKGAVLTHANLGVQQAIVGEAWGLSRTDVLLHVLPLHHMHGLCIALLNVLGQGGAARMMRAFDARRVWDAMAEATVFMAVPTIYQKLFAAFDGASEADRTRWAENARALRLATSGSAALPVTLAERWRQVTGRIPLERFGMTEVGVGLSNPLDGERKPGSVGHPLRTVETRVVDESGNDAPVGELWIAGPSVFREYHGRKDATATAFVARDGDGERARWFRTGDTVTRDADGAFRILGRTSVDILKSGGYKLSALEIEEALREHPSVLEVAVVGVPDETWGDRVVACVVRRDGAPPVDEAMLRAFAKERLASYKVPKNVLFFEGGDALPRNAMGKVQKPELAKRAAARIDDRRHEPPT
jgi:malonyl-CoA/methylmalonyl-CoA synthetase